MSLVTRPMRLALPNDTDVEPSITDGVYLKSELPAFVRQDQDGVDRGGTPGIIKLGKVDGERCKGLDLYPLLASGNDDDATSLKIFRVNPIMDIGSNGGYRSLKVDLLYTIVVTASATTYDAGDIKDGVEYRACDGAVLSDTSDLATHLQTVAGDAIYIHPPGNDEQAVISLTDLYGAWGIIIEPNAASGSLFNMLYEPKT